VRHLRQSPFMAKLFRVPHTLVLLSAMILLAWAASFVVPKGAYQRIKDSEGREVVQPGSYAPAAAAGHVSPVALFTAVPRGFAQSQDIIFFVFIIGGAIAVIRATGAIDGALGLTLRTFGRQRALLIGAGLAVFATGSSTLGMAEEYLPFALVLVALCHGLRMDAITAVAIIVVGSGIGYGVAAINPFTVVIAQQIAGVPPTSGLWLRLAITLPFLAIGFHHVYRYAVRVQNDPGTSLVADIPPPDFGHADAHPALAPRHTAVLALTAAAIALLVWGISTRGWYLTEMGAVFIGLAVLVAAVGRLSPDRTARAFADGAAELTVTALLIGFARAIKIMLEDGQIIDTIIHGVATPLATLGAYGSAVGMLFIQSVLNLFIPSGSGQAFVTMPIMAPIADLTGVTRQAAVLAYQFGDGLTNMIIPTNAILVGILGLARIPYDRWVKFIAPLLAKLLLAAALTMCLAVAVGYR
jgi:uncharacterized ion transporter superfamily protein YfcC